MDNDDEPVGRDQGKQKKILMLLAPVFVILLVMQGPTLLSLVTGSEDAESTSEESTSVDGSAAATADTAGAPAESALGPDTATAATATQPVFVVVDSDLPPRADESELTLLTRFEHRDPFIPGVDGTVGGDAADESDEGSSAEDADAAAAAAAEREALEGDGGDDSASGEGDSAGSGDDEDLMEPESGTDPDDGGGIAEARLQVNGSSSVVRVGSAFPSFDPVFRLESLAGDAVRIGLVRGSYSTGSDLVDIEPGETRTLISQPDGTRYRIRLVGVVN